MKLKHAVLLLLVLSLVFSLAACGGKSAGNDNANAIEPPAQTDNQENTGTPAPDEEIKPEDNATLVIWEDKSQRPTMDELAKQFTEKYGVQIKIEEVAPPDAVTKLTNDGPAGVGGDVVVFPHDQLGRAVSTGLVLPNDIFADATTQGNEDAAVQATSFEDVLYGYPKSVETYALIYNKDLVPNPPKTWDELIAFAKTFNDTANKKYGFMMEVGNFYFGYPFFASQGGYVFGNNGTDANDIGLSNDGANSGLNTLSALKEILPVKNADITYDIKKGLFTSGKLAMDLNGPWTVGDYRNANINFGVVPIPAFGDRPAVSFSGVRAYYVNAYTKYPNAAKLFAHFASSKDAQLLDNKLTGAIPSNKEAGSNPQIKDDPIISGFFNQFKFSQPMPSIPEMGQIWGPIGAAMVEIWDNGADPKSATEKAVQQIKDAIKTGGK